MAPSARNWGAFSSTPTGKGNINSCAAQCGGSGIPLVPPPQQHKSAGGLLRVKSGLCLPCHSCPLCPCTRTFRARLHIPGLFG